jgi:DnaK suppressor protein
MTMTANLEWVRQVLERRLAEATAPTRELRVSILIQQIADPLDMTLQAAEREIAVQRLALSSILAWRIRSAIERWDNGSFGLCLKCEDNIAPKRLNALPWAEFCIRCQEEADRSDREQGAVRRVVNEAEAA